MNASKIRSGVIHARWIYCGGHPREDAAIWWQDGKVQAIGEPSTLASQVPSDIPQFDLPHCIVTPGFVDSHTHFGLWALGRTRVKLASARTRAEAVRMVGEARPSQGWILGQGWDANGWDRSPTRWDLDPVQQVPVYLDSLDVHAAWLNSAALGAAGISRNTQDPPGGRIVRDPAGEPTGILLERAVELAHAILPPAPPAALVAALREGQREAHRLGITGIHNVEGHEVYAGFATLEGQGELRLRVLFHHPVADLVTLAAEGTRSGQGGRWLTHGGVKMFLDGSLGSRTAWMLDPYEGTRDRGMAVTDLTMASTAMETAAANGLACVVHAIGDAAVRRALSLMETLPSVALPHRIEHFQCVHPADLGRASAAGIVLSMQPAHILTDIPLAERHWGKRSAGAYAFKSLLQTGATLAFGSDAPVASLDPREGVYAAMTRRLDGGGDVFYPAERIGFAETIAAYTSGPAYAAGLMNRRGTLGPGMDADLVAWDHASKREAETALAFRGGRAVLTVVDGEVVFAG